MRASHKNGKTDRLYQMPNMPADDTAADVRERVKCIAGQPDVDLAIQTIAIIPASKTKLSDVAFSVHRTFFHLDNSLVASLPPRLYVAIAAPEARRAR